MGIAKTALAELDAPLAATPEEAAASAGLRYVSDRNPGYTRRRAGRGFVYHDADGRRIADSHALERIRRLAIPPAWQEVWICPRADGHIQAVGRDSRRRKQYRYHARWREVRDANKYDRMIAFAAHLPAIRRRVARDLSRRGLPREKVLATVVRLLETSLVRVGNQEYARANGSFGLTTLRSRHARVTATRARFRFRGKSGKEREVAISDRRIARVVRECQELPGQELFQYVEDGEVRSIDSGDVNRYLREATGQDFTAKDFRTWAGTLLAAIALREVATDISATRAKKAVVEGIEQVAARLGNTPTVCRSCYVHPTVLESFARGVRLGAAKPRAIANGFSGLTTDERALVRLLKTAA